ncbi:MAG: DNA methyltransferase [Desulfotomaculales bacterium]
MRSYLREMRRKSGVALKAMARDLEIDPGFLSRVERGLVSAPDHIIEAYHKRFGTLPHDITSPLEFGCLRENTAQYRVTQFTFPFESKPPVPARADLLPKVQTSPLHDVPPLFYPSLNPYLADLTDPTRPPKLVPLPYTNNISAGKNSYVYDAHTYHTKVPPEGLKLLIDYYTRPGDVVLDPFCGSGMTGIAATETGRKALLVDLSPAATFITWNMLTPVPAHRYLEAVQRVLKHAVELEQTLYNTHCRVCGRRVPMLYMVWSYGFLCRYCDREFILWDVAREERPSPRESKIRTEFPCPYCGKNLKKRLLKKTRRYPVQVGYKCCQPGLKEAVASPDEHDLALLAQIESEGIPKDLWYPVDPFPEGVNTRQPIAAGITSVDKAYTPRALWAMAYLWDIAARWPDPEIRTKLFFTLTSLYQRVTVFAEFRFWGGSGNTANFNVPGIMNEQNVFKAFERKAHTISWYFSNAPTVARQFRISTQSACWLPQIPSRSIDYILTDPPFGGNINYSEMNFLWESWLRAFTDNTEEIIINDSQGKGLGEYKKLLTKALVEARRVLKDDGWMSIMFHNSSAKVWHAFQQAIFDAGFAIEGIQIFDKKHGTFKQFVSENAVGYNLVLHCRKAKAPQRIEENGKAEVHRQIIGFIRETLSRSRDRYVIKYNHVPRKKELDYRKLYAEWLATALPVTRINISFEEFRSIVDRVISEHEAANSVIRPK